MTTDLAKLRELLAESVADGGALESIDEFHARMTRRANRLTALVSYYPALLDELETLRTRTMVLDSHLDTAAKENHALRKDNERLQDAYEGQLKRANELFQQLDRLLKSPRLKLPL